MSAIGEYVHYYGMNYLMHGTTRKGNFSNYESQKSKIKDLAGSMKVQNPKTLKQIQQTVNSIKTGSNQYFKDIRSLVQKQIIEKYQKKVGSANLNNFTVDLANPSSVTASPISAHIQDHKLVFSVKELTEKVNKVQQNLKQLVARKEIDVGIAEKYSEELKTLYEKIYKESENQIKQWGYEKAYTKNSNSKDIARMREMMNNIIQQYMQYAPVNLYEGTLWETVLKAAGYVASGAGMKEIEEGIKSLQGQQNVKIEVKNNFMDSFKINETINKYVKMDTKGQISRRSKVDVTMIWNNQQINISAKNIRIWGKYHWIDVVSESPLLVMVMGMDPNFVNHYLNVYSLHDSTQSVLPDNWNIADDMKYALFYEGLTGHNFANNNDIANVMAINDKNTGNVRLIDMTTILNRLEDNITAISVLVGGSNIKSVHFKNIWQNTLEERIVNIIDQLHALKVNIKFNLGAVVDLV